MAPWAPEFLIFRWSSGVHSSPEVTSLLLVEIGAGRSCLPPQMLTSRDKQAQTISCGRKCWPQKPKSCVCFGMLTWWINCLLDPVCLWVKAASVFFIFWKRYWLLNWMASRRQRNMGRCCQSSCAGCSAGRVWSPPSRCLLLTGLLLVVTVPMPFHSILSTKAETVPVWYSIWFF